MNLIGNSLIALPHHIGSGSAFGDPQVFTQERSTRSVALRLLSPVDWKINEKRDASVKKSVKQYFIIFIVKFSSQR